MQSLCSLRRYSRSSLIRVGVSITCMAMKKRTHPAKPSINRATNIMIALPSRSESAPTPRNQTTRSGHAIAKIPNAMSKPRVRLGMGAVMMCRATTIPDQTTTPRSVQSTKSWMNRSVQSVKSLPRCAAIKPHATIIPTTAMRCGDRNVRGRFIDTSTIVDELASPLKNRCICLRHASALVKWKGRAEFSASPSVQVLTYFCKIEPDSF